MKCGVRTRGDGAIQAERNDDRQQETMPSADDEIEEQRDWPIISFVTVVSLAIGLRIFFGNSVLLWYREKYGWRGWILVNHERIRVSRTKQSADERGRKTIARVKVIVLCY